MTVIARRLPVGGAITFPAPDEASVHDLGESGFWNSVSSPHAAYYNGKTYLAWTDDAGDIYAAEYVHSTETLSTPVLLTSGAPAVDGTIHVSPAVLVRSSDRRIVVSVVANGGTHFPTIWISTEPEDATAFEAGIDVGAGGVFTYTSLAETSDGMYLWVGYWTSGTRKLAYYKSADGGETWGSVVQVLEPATDSTFFWRISHNSTRMDIYATSTDRSSPASVYHFIFEGDVLYDSEGNAVAGSAPFPVTDGTLVTNGSLGTADTATATYDGGEPCAALYIDAGSSVLIRRARWTGSVWDVDTVADSGGEVGSNANINGAAIADASTVYVPVKVGSFFELYRYTTSDGGTTWDPTAITSGSAADNAMPECPQDADPAARVVWGLGTYTDDSDFDFTVQAYG